MDMVTHMVGDMVGVSAGSGRIEIRTGIGRRRSWSEEEKLQIVAESYEPGAIISEVARRHELTPNHLYGWRKNARASGQVTPAAMFVPVVTASGPELARGAGSISIELSGMVLKVAPDVDLDWLSRVLGAVKAAA